MPVAIARPVVHVKPIKISVVKASRPCKVVIKTLADGSSIRTVSVNNGLTTVNLVGPRVTAATQVRVHVDTDVKTVTE